MINQILITTLLLFKTCHLMSIDEGTARKFMGIFDDKQAEIYSRKAGAYESNMTQENLDAQAELAKWKNENWKKFISYPWQSYNNADLRRQIQKNLKLGTSALLNNTIKKLTKTLSRMVSIYSTAEICSFSDKNKCNLRLQPDLEYILLSSENPEELKYAWLEWRNASGKNVRHLFKDYVDLSNEAAVLNNFTDMSTIWINYYEDRNFKEEIKKLWEQIRPLYLQIHSYVRNKLRQKYGDNIIPRDGYIPAHLLRNMWSQFWGNVYKYMIPYPDFKNADITSEMLAQGYTALKIFKTAEEFFTSLNMSAMPQEFWTKSIFENPKDSDMVCHPSSWDLHKGNDYRIKQCTLINFKSFLSAHHEMGHIEYFLEYKQQPFSLRSGVNYGFHEAVGNTICLSVSTNKHLHKIGLLKTLVDNDETIINKMFETALNKIVLLPYAYIMDLWRWDVFSGKITPENYNSAWWKLRNDYQGIEAPVPRSEDDFDPGAKYHIVANVPFIRYFVSFVIQFQFHKALCEKAGQYEPNNSEKALHKCDIYQSTEAGNALANMLQMGSSKSWHDAMESLTGGQTMDASALLEYFAPLQKWLTEENKKTGEYIGWKTSIVQGRR